MLSYEFSQYEYCNARYRPDTKDVYIDKNRNWMKDSQGVSGYMA